MKIGFCGCSHSTSSYGKSWAQFMKEKLNAVTFDLSASGVGNEMNIERLKYLAEKRDIDFYVYQITDSSRLVLGLYGNDVKEEYEKFYDLEYNSENVNCTRNFNGINYYTFKINENDEFLNKLLKTDYSVQKFFENNVLISDFNMKIKIFHTLMSIKYIFDFYGKKILFFSWGVDILKLAKENGYGKIMSSMDIVDGCVEDFAQLKNLKKVDVSHYGTESHEIIYNEYLEPKLIEFMKKYNII
jgi:hypothetical protein